MAYSIEQGYFKPRKLDRTQRGLLIGLPIIALLLAFGALRGSDSNNNSGDQGAKRIPVVSTLSVSSNKPNSGSDNSSSGSAGSATPQPSGTSSIQGSSPTSPGGAATTGGSTVIGGMGGGPTGGTSGGGTTGGGGATGGGTTSALASCSIGQIATVNCQVPACTPTVTLAPGQKAILGVNGTCIVLN